MTVNQHFFIIIVACSLFVMSKYNSKIVIHLLQLILCNLTEYCLTIIGLHRSGSQCVAVYMNSLTIMSLFLAACHGNELNEQRIYGAPALYCKTIKYRLIIDEDDLKGWSKPHVGKGERSENRYFLPDDL